MLWVTASQLPLITTRPRATQTQPPRGEILRCPGRPPRWTPRPCSPPALVQRRGHHWPAPRRAESQGPDLPQIQSALAAQLCCWDQTQTWSRGTFGVQHQAKRCSDSQPRSQAQKHQKHSIQNSSGKKSSDTVKSSITWTTTAPCSPRNAP